MIDSSKIKKIEYLNKYIKSKEKYIFLDNQLKGKHSIDYNHIKSTVHKSLTEKIYERDLAYREMIKSYMIVVRTIDTFPIWYQCLLYDIFINGLSFNKIEKKLGIPKNEIKEMFDFCIDNMI